MPISFCLNNSSADATVGSASNFSSLGLLTDFRRSLAAAMGLAFLTAVIATPAASTIAQEKPAEADKESESKGVQVKLGDLTMLTPGTWEKAKPRSRMLSHEFSAPAKAEENDPTARITVMAAGGSVDANIQRWYGQFSQPDGKSTKDVAKTEKFEVDGTTVHWVDITGTFAESMGGGPFAPGKVVKREGYRMIGVIAIPKESRAQYFIKMTGDAEVVGKLADDFKKSLKEMK